MFQETTFKSCFLILISMFTISSAFDPFFIGSLGAVGLGGAYYYKDKIMTKFCFQECCEDPNGKWINSRPSFHDLNKLIFGQHIALETVSKLVSRHLKNQSPDKPLVLSFHGWTGVGKNHLSHLLATKIYKQYRKTGKSNFVHTFVATQLFNKQKLEDVVDHVEKALKNCDRSLFIFDEVDKFPETYLNALLPFLDYGSPYKRAIFLLLGNSGGDAINTMVNKLLLDGIPREDIQYSDLEKTITAQATKQIGGLKDSELIRRGIIDLFVPFMPLERRHVEDCIANYLIRHHNYSFPHINPGRDFIDKVVEQITFKDDKFSIYGCKRVSSIVDILLPDN